MQRKYVVIGSVLTCLLLYGCSSKYQMVRSGERDHQKLRDNAGDHQYIRFRQEVEKFHQHVRKQWGDDAEVSGVTTFVKYNNKFKSRATIDFAARKVTVETTDDVNPEDSLKQAIVATLLTPKDPTKVDLYSDSDPVYYGEPFLHEEVLDHDGKAIRWPWRANRYAQHLIDTEKKKRTVKTQGGVKKTAYYVSFEMVGAGKYSDVKVAHAMGKKYKLYVLKQAKRFNLDPSLIFAIMETESHFNPYAVSSIPAFGLMQVVPGSAGKDAWKLIKKRNGRPSKRYLFDPENNIEMGSAYLHILHTRYLAGIKNSKSREYCVIAAYNTGSGNVLKTFSKNRKYAVRVINSLSPQQVYNRLKSSLPYEETRRYVKKVTSAKRRYVSL
jgi:membrane-bound lytic murein transglycosylase C